MLKDDARICFFLLPDFPLYALVPATDALRIANQNAGERLFDWSFASASGGPVPANNGMTVDETLAIRSGELPPFVIVCAGNEPTQHLSKPVLNWLRRLAAHGSNLGALDTGAFALAAAGVLGGYRITLHWEAIPVFRDAFPEVDVVEQIFVIDRERFTAAGGISSLDLMLALIGAAHGPALAQTVANAFVHGRPRPAETPQLLDGIAKSSNRTLVQRCVRLMRQNLAYPVPIVELCDGLSISRRRLERLFVKETGWRSERVLRLAPARGGPRAALLQRQFHRPHCRGLRIFVELALLPGLPQPLRRAPDGREAALRERGAQQVPPLRANAHQPAAPPVAALRRGARRPRRLTQRVKRVPQMDNRRSRGSVIMKPRSARNRRAQRSGAAARFTDGGDAASLERERAGDRIGPRSAGDFTFGRRRASSNGRTRSGRLGTQARQSGGHPDGDEIDDAMGSQLHRPDNRLRSNRRRRRRGQGPPAPQLDVLRSHAGFALGKDKGYYKDAGINLDIRSGNGSGSAHRLVANGDSTFSYGSCASMINLAAQGAAARLGRR